MDNPNVTRVSEWIEVEGGLGKICIVLLDFSNVKLDRLDNGQNTEEMEG